ncbi:hypothetical protein [Burkholderia contaminans]|uniref:hypothetical protein n=1 Tax=Burkholderia contaminans TaxID=488447 RepID=UPI002D7E867C|nr:hypothetical protein [Burkholderia contaminans]
MRKFTAGAPVAQVTRDRLFGVRSKIRDNASVIFEREAVAGAVAGGAGNESSMASRILGEFIGGVVNFIPRQDM